MTRWALLFPGQGSQALGMGKDLVQDFSVARMTFEEASDVLGYDLSHLCFEGPEEDLKMTERTQPAVLTVSVAVSRVLRQEFDPIMPVAVAGHSLGEWTALVEADALAFADAVNLVRWRGHWMQEAVPQGVGAMAAVVGMDFEEVTLICTEAAESQVCVPANLNSPQQVVISGHAEAVERAQALVKEKGKRAIPLAVSAPFHSPLMQPAADKLATLLEETTFQKAKCPVISNVDAKPYSEPSDIPDRLVRQVTSSVRWTESMQAMLAMEIDEFIELGQGRVLGGLMRQIDRSVLISSLGTPKNISRFLSKR